MRPRVLSCARHRPLSPERETPVYTGVFLSSCMLFSESLMSASRDGPEEDTLENSSASESPSPADCTSFGTVAPGRAGQDGGTCTALSAGVLGTVLCRLVPSLLLSWILSDPGGVSVASLLCSGTPLGMQSQAGVPAADVVMGGRMGGCQNTGQHSISGIQQPRIACRFN